MLKDDLNIICQELKEAFISELLRQGHKATGQLIDSISVQLEQMFNSFSIVGRFAFYGPYVDYGRSPGVRRVPIDALINWIRIKQIDLRGKKERNVAFAMMTAIYKRGIPSNGADKKRFMSGVLEAKEQRIMEAVATATYNMFEVEIFNLVEKTQTSINSVNYHK